MALTGSQFTINKALGKPVSMRSHFLHTAPVIALGENYDDFPRNLQSFYTLLHEYLHYEQFTSWPYLVINYFIDTVESAHFISKIAAGSKKVGNSWGQYDFLKYGTSLLSTTCFARKPDGSFAVNGPLGYDVLLEGAALLNFRIKPPDVLTTPSETVIEYLLKNPGDERNVVHYTGVKKLIDIEQDILELASFEAKTDGISEVSYIGSLLPGILAIYTFGLAMRLNGFSSDHREWRKIRDFVGQKYQVIWETYVKKSYEFHDEVFQRGNYELVTDLLSLRELSLTGFHAFLSVLYSSMFMKATQLAQSKREYDLYMSIICNLIMLLRLWESMNEKTLLEVGVPKLWKQWVPVPVVLFSRRRLDCIRLDFDAVPKGKFLMRWAHSITRYEDLVAWYSWIRMLFINRLCKGLKSKQVSGYCPIWEWVEAQFTGIVSDPVGSTRDFLTEFCNRSMNHSLRHETLSEKLKPSSDYCSFYASGGKHFPSGLSKCYFHHNMELYLPR